MQCLEARLVSYAAVTRPKKHAKVAFPLSAESHPFLTPAALAAAGFYHYPGKESDPESHDTCRCFLCGLVLGGWDEDDDPFAEHVKREGDCAWKELVCRIEVDRASGGPGRLRTTYPDNDSLPSSAKSSAYRETTFSDWWPHKKPSAKVLAQAGFISTPSKAAPDGTTCPLCKYEVEQWEEDDDPLAVHQHKEPACPFFTATVEKKSRRKTATTAKRGGRATTTVSRAASAAEPAPEPEPEPEPECEAEPVVEPEAEPEPAPAPKRRGRPPKASTAASSLAASTTSTATRKTTRTRKTKVKEAEEVEEAVEPVAAAEQEPVEELAPVEEEEAPKKGRKTKPLPKKRTTRKTAATIEAEEAPEASTESEVAVEAPPKPLPKSKVKATKTTKAAATKAAAAAAAAAEAEASAPAPAVAASEPTRIPLPTSPRTRSVPTRPLSQLDRFANLPAPAPMPDVGSAGTTKPAPASPSVRHAVAAMVRDASPAAAAPAASVARPASPDKELPPLPELPPLSDEQRKMSLEEYVRQQYAARADEMRASGETLITAWETRTREARSRIEQA